MIICSKCKKRIAKRACSALGSSLCHLCCGLLREKEIHCPPSCPHLSPHRRYQEKRLLEKKPSSGRSSTKEEVLKDERLVWLIFQLEAPIMDFAARLPSLTDKEILLALEYARGKIEKGPSVLILPGENVKPKNEIGEAIYQAAENARWEAPVILSSGLDVYKKEERLVCLDRVVASVKFQAQCDLGGRAYLQNLAERFARIQSLAQPNKIITPA